MTSSRFVSALMLTALVSSAPGAASALDVPAPPLPAWLAGPAPASVMTIGSMRVEKYGSGSPALIFIPGLSCGSWIWKPAAARYAASHAVYLVTLGGFDGVPVPTGNLLDSADASLVTLIGSEKLDRPVIIGHSMGGHLALRFGEEHAALVRGVVSVDGTPVFPTLITASAADRAQQAAAIAAGIRAASPGAFAKQTRTTVGTMVNDQTNADLLAGKMAGNDQAAVAEYFGELYGADIRPALPELTVPALEIAPVPTDPQPYEGPSAQGVSIDVRAPFYKDFYASMLATAPHVTVATILNSKHFVMIDQPQAFYDRLTSFIASLGP